MANKESMTDNATNSPINSAPAPDSTIDNVTDKLFINVLARSFRVLEVFRYKNCPLSFSELVQETGLNRSAVQRILHTLKTLHYLDQTPETKKYFLSLRMLRLSQAALAHDVIKELAVPFLEKLNKYTAETVNLMIPEGNEIVYIERFPSFHAVSVDLKVGSRLPIYCTAAGRVFLAYMPQNEAHERLLQSEREKMTTHTITELDAIKGKLDEIRTQGYALNNQEAFIGDISIAAPIFNELGMPVAAVNVAVLYPRWEIETARTQLVPKVLKTAKEITKALIEHSSRKTLRVKNR